MYHFCITLPESNEGYRFPFRNKTGTNDLLKSDLIKMKTVKTDKDIDQLYILNSAESQQPTKHEKYCDESFEAASVKKKLHVPDLNRLKQATGSRRKWRFLLGILLRLFTRWSFASLLAMKWTDGFVAVRTMGSVTDKHIFILEFCFLFKMISLKQAIFAFAKNGIEG